MTTALASHAWAHEDPCSPKRPFRRGIVAAMPLSEHAPIAFIPTNKAEAARNFYEQTLGLRFISDDKFAMVFRVGPGTSSSEGTMLRLVRAGEFTPAPFTIFGWEAPDIENTIDELKSKGVEFLRFSFFEQDERSIWRAPNGNAVAWFKDPDGNTLSVSKHE